MRAAQAELIKNGTRLDRRTLQEAMRENIKNGRGTRSLIDALEQASQHTLNQPINPAPRQRGRLQTFLVAFGFGVLWQATRRRR